MQICSIFRFFWSILVKCCVHLRTSGEEYIPPILTVLLSGAPNDRFLGNICSEPSRLAKIFESPRTAKIFENVSWGLFVGLRVSGFVWFVHLRISDFVVISKF